MQQRAFSMQFRGHSTRFSPGVMTARAVAPSGGIVTRVDGTGVRVAFEPVDGDEALLERRLTFLNDTDFEEVGTISFGAGNALRYRSVGQGSFGPASEPGLRHGTAMWSVDGGAGIFTGASGRIVSNFLISDSGELTDHQFGVLFLQTSEHSR